MVKLFIVPTDTCFGLWCFLDDIKSYNEIYQIKKRDFSKPLSIFLDNLDTLKKITNLTDKQLDFLKNYQKPWTILIDKKEIKDNNIIQNINKLPNKDIYEKVGFRIAHNFMHYSMIKDVWYFFLTSANISGQESFKSAKDLKEKLSKEIEKYNIRVYSHTDFNIETPYYFSDVFEFENDEIIYFRKN